MQLQRDGHRRHRIAIADGARRAAETPSLCYLRRSLAASKVGGVHVAAEHVARRLAGPEDPILATGVGHGREELPERLSMGLIYGVL